MNNNENNKIYWVIGIIVFAIVFFSAIGNKDNNDGYAYSDNTFSLISSSDNKVLDKEIREFAKKEKFDIHIEYDDTLKITRRLNQGEKYDAVWLSNSIWMYSLDSNKVKVSDTKATSINPIVFGIKKSKAEELGFVGKEIYTKDIVAAVESGKLKFSMSNPVTTNSGASAYLGILTTLAGNPEVLTKEMLNNEELKTKLKTFFSGVERNSGDENFLEETFLKGDYEAVFTYESSIININKKLEKNNKEILYAIYPVDGVSISDSPIGYIDQKNEKKKEIYDKLVAFLTSEKGQNTLASYGRRTWYGGTTTKANKDIFNPKWGIDTNKYISPLKYPSTSVINDALLLYQTTLRKPVHVVFCLDYSGSMIGDGEKQLKDAMDFILSERAAANLLQFSGEDIVEVVPFSNGYDTVWKASNPSELPGLLSQVVNKSPGGGTALYPATIKALELLKAENRDKYNTSIIVMTDGEGNIGYFEDLEQYYKKIGSEIPIYSIQFASADRSQLDAMANLSNGKVFDGTTSLIDAFTEVRGYN